MRTQVVTNDTNVAVTNDTNEASVTVTRVTASAVGERARFSCSTHFDRRFNRASIFFVRDAFLFDRDHASTL